MQPAVEALPGQIQEILDAHPDQPWCVHRLTARLSDPAGGGGDRVALDVIERAADGLVRSGRARGERVSALSIGVHCQDALYWSAQNGHDRLDSFGSEYESPRVLHRLASHFECRGL